VKVNKHQLIEKITDAYQRRRFAVIDSPESVAEQNHLKCQNSIKPFSRNPFNIQRILEFFATTTTDGASSPTPQNRPLGAIQSCPKSTLIVSLKIRQRFGKLSLF
jgi:hypothetical protein